MQLVTGFLKMLTLFSSQWWMAKRVMKTQTQLLVISVRCLKKVRGKLLYERHQLEGGCVSCHMSTVQSGSEETAPVSADSWKTEQMTRRLFCFILLSF